MPMVDHCAAVILLSHKLMLGETITRLSVASLSNVFAYNGMALSSRIGYGSYDISVSR
jgi:hypothetical protein